MSQSEVQYALIVTDVKDLAGNQLEPPDREKPYQVVFLGRGASGLIDSDGDGLSDAEEQLGWQVVVTLANGQTSAKQVTSDPGDPELPVDHPINVAARDTDGDGIDDATDKATAPTRETVTDDDQVERLDGSKPLPRPSKPGLRRHGAGRARDRANGTSAMFATPMRRIVRLRLVTGNRNARMRPPQPAINIGAVAK